MIGLSLIALLWLGSPSNPSSVQDFERAFYARNTDIPTEKPDPAISKALNILIQATRKGQPLKTFEDAAPPGFQPVSGSRYRLGKLTSVVVGMGSVSRLAVFDARGELNLPKEFQWGFQQEITPHALSSGGLVVEEREIVPGDLVSDNRLVWLKRQGNRFVVVRKNKFKAGYDLTDFKVKGNSVTVQTIDEFQALAMHRSVASPLRITTWDGSQGKPRIVRTVLKDQPIRAVDQAIVEARKAKKPTRLQRQILLIWTRQSSADRYDEKKLKDGAVLIVLNNRVDDKVTFKLKRTGKGYRVVSIARAN